MSPVSAGIAALALVSVLGGIWSHGWHTGTQGERATWQERTTALRQERAILAARVEGLAATLARISQERDALAQQLEDAAHADNDASRPAFGPASVSRLNRR
ncbi:hypothetical protein [Pararhodobacter sp.]|uniref:hypothetical protein n=1 Tax=Pararhodobacter sp. TaxID=2127056 RepID=UPI002FDDB986